MHLFILSPIYLITVLLPCIATEIDPAYPTDTNIIAKVHLLQESFFGLDWKASFYHGTYHIVLHTHVFMGWPALTFGLFEPKGSILVTHVCIPNTEPGAWQMLESG